MVPIELSPLEAFQRYSSLGPDFLTWLMVTTLEEDDCLNPPSEPGLKINIEGPLLFVGEGGEASRVSLAGKDSAAAPEVNSALRQGKRLTRARVVLTAQENEWSFTLDAEYFDVKAVKLPVPPIPDLDQFMSMRVDSVMRLYMLIEELFDMFLAIRLDAAQWKEITAGWRKSSVRRGE